MTSQNEKNNNLKAREIKFQQNTHKTASNSLAAQTKQAVKMVHLFCFSLPSRSFACDTLRLSQSLCVLNCIINPIMLLPRNFCSHINILNEL